MPRGVIQPGSRFYRFIEGIENPNEFYRNETLVLARMQQVFLSKLFQRQVPLESAFQPKRDIDLEKRQINPEAIAAVKHIALAYLGSADQFKKLFSGTLLNKSSCPHFNGSWIYATMKLFDSFGIPYVIGDFPNTPHGYWEKFGSKENIIKEIDRIFIQVFPEFNQFLDQKTHSIKPQLNDQAFGYIQSKLSSKADFQAIYGSKLTETRKRTKLPYFDTHKRIVNDLLAYYGIKGALPVGKIRMPYTIDHRKWEDMQPDEVVKTLLDQFYARFPDFIQRFPLDVQGQVPQALRIKAHDYIAAKIKTIKDFKAIFPGIYSPKRKISMKLLNEKVDSYKKLRAAIFSHLGILFPEDRMYTGASEEQLLTYAQEDLVRAFPEVTHLVHDGRANELKALFLSFVKDQRFKQTFPSAYISSQVTNVFHGSKRFFLIKLAATYGVSLSENEFHSFRRIAYKTLNNDEASARLKELFPDGNPTEEALELIEKNPTYIENVYFSTLDYELRYQVACALITNHRIQNPSLIFEHLFPMIKRNTPENKARYQQLMLLALENGYIIPDKHAAEKELGKRLSQTDLEELTQYLPSYLLTAIAVELAFGKLTDDQKTSLFPTTQSVVLREFLGDLAVKPSIETELPLESLLQRFPDSVLRNQNKIISNIVREFFIKQTIRLFSEGEEIGFQKLRLLIEHQTSETKREFFQEIHDQFQHISKMEYPAKFNTTIPGWFTENSPFPLFFQKYFLSEFLSTPNRRKLLNGSTGSTKTACSFLAMESSTDVKKITIFGPKQAGQTWVDEANKFFLPAEKPDVFVVNTWEDFQNTRFCDAKYVFVSAELIGFHSKKHKTQKVDIANMIVKRRSTDGIIIDEIDTLRHSEIQKSSAIADMVNQLHGKLGNKLPILGLTATPLVSGLKDLDFPLMLLYPEKYDVAHNSFSKSCAQNAQLAFNVLFGDKLLLQWDQKDIFGDKAPSLMYKKKPVSLTSFQHALYTHILELPLDTLTKIRSLQDVLLDPNLTLQLLKKKKTKNVHTESVEQLRKNWQVWSKQQNDPETAEPFNLNWIAKYTSPEIAVQLFLNGKINYESTSGKYQELLQMMNEIVQSSTTNNPHKLLIIVPYHADGITRHDKIETESMIEFLKRQTISQGVDIRVVDGGISMQKRLNIAQDWRESKKPMIVLANMEAMSRSMNWAVQLGQAHFAYTSWPYDWASFVQSAGRGNRPGQEKPTQITVLESDQTIDYGLFLLTQYKKMLTEAVLHGIPISEDDQKLFKDSEVSKGILFNQRKTGQTFLHNLIATANGQGYQENKALLEKKIQGMSTGELFARFYFDEGRDESHTVGHNAKMVADIISTTRANTMLVLGAGTCLLARSLADLNIQTNITNLEMNRAMLQIAHTSFPQKNLGEMHEGNAAKLDYGDSSFDFVDCSFVLPWTKLGKNEEFSDVVESERVKELTEMNRVLNSNGEAVLTFPESTFDDHTYSRFTEVLQRNFGFQIHQQSGKSFAVINGKKSKRIGWIIRLRKVDNPHLDNLHREDLEFLYDKTYISKTKKTRKPKSKQTPLEFPTIYSTFCIVDPKTDQVISTITDRNVIKKVIFMNKKSQWNKLLRAIEKKLDINYEKADQQLCALIQELLQKSGSKIQDQWNDELQTKAIRAIAQLRK